MEKINNDMIRYIHSNITISESPTTIRKLDYLIKEQEKLNSRLACLAILAVVCVVTQNEKIKKLRKKISDLKEEKGD
jgi:hypothetical protein